MSRVKRHPLVGSVSQFVTCRLEDGGACTLGTVVGVRRSGFGSQVQSPSWARPQLHRMIVGKIRRFSIIVNERRDRTEG